MTGATTISMRMSRPGWRVGVLALAGVAAACVVAARPHDSSPAPLPRAGALLGVSVSGTSVPTTTTPSPTQSPGPPTCADAVAALPMRQRVAQLVMVGFDPATPGAAKQLVVDDQVGGLFISGADTSALHDGEIAAAKASSKLPLFVAMDEEGGRVQRVPGPHGRLPSARTMTATMSSTQVRALATSLGVELRGLGVNVDFAPDADVSDQPADAVIGDRSFSNDPTVVTAYAGAFAAGLRSSGVLPVLKHFPGHGHATGDSHTGPAIDPPLSALTTDDLVPYRTLPNIGRTSVMVGHLEVPGLTGTVPASLSPAAYQLLRQTYRFDGVAFTDDLGTMVAITAHYDLSDSVLTALQSGADVALWVTGGAVPQILDRLVAATENGTLPVSRVDQAATRVLIAKGVCTA
ncbi:MAG TPA: glycoside hydrolase family 3 N-terminal domain-containing protein [Pseudonocardiaceae bacterium]|nr:glycoside hydrolase family 3 N-terminal domain-containing protein [Pseudonocardiaceae bacterium]